MTDDSDGPGDLGDRWESDVVLADGGTVRVRPIRPSDGERLRAFHSRQSRESVYYRFFSPRPRLSDAEVEHLTTVDGIDRMALVALLDDELVGVARYDRPSGRFDAEVAFFTDDRHAGRGIATLLLEWLAARAREVGISRFTAQVLPENRRMTSVFRQAGFDVVTAFESGVIEVELDLEPTPEAAEAIAARARQAEKRAVAHLLEPHTVAVIGAGTRPEAIGHRVLRSLLAHNFSGIVLPVNPNAESVGGVRAHPSLLDVGIDVDLAVVAVPAPSVAAVVAEAGRARVPAVAVISAGFAEAGAEGRRRQDEVLSIARRYGMRLLGPNCLGVINTDPAVRLHATFAEVAVRPGRAALLSQSGTLGAVIVEHATRCGLGISSMVSVGNRADLSGNDLLAHWADDQRTDAVMLYLESFGNPRRFGRNVARVTAAKPVFAVRSGGAFRSLSDHRESGWLDDETVDALLDQSGVIRVATLAELLDATRLAVSQPAPPVGAVAIVGNSSGALLMAAEACLAAGLVLAELGEPARRALRRVALTDADQGDRNPVDLRYDSGPDDYETAVEAVCSDPAVHLVLVAWTPESRRDGYAEIGDVLARAAERHPGVAMVGSFFGAEQTMIPLLDDRSIPLFEFPDSAAMALGRLARYGSWRAARTTAEFTDLPGERSDAISELVRSHLDARGPGWLAPADAREVLATAGFEVVESVDLGSLEELDELDTGSLAFPVAAKAADRELGARLEASGISLDIHDADELRAAARAMYDKLGEAVWPLVVQPMVPPGTNLRVAIVTHPVVGTVLEVGPGGLAGRFLRSSVRVLPVSETDAREMAASVDAEIGRRDDVVALITRLSAVAEAVPQLTDVAFDPVIVTDDGPALVDVAVRVQPLQAELPPVRRMG